MIVRQRNNMQCIPTTNRECIRCQYHYTKQTLTMATVPSLADWNVYMIPMFTQKFALRLGINCPARIITVPHGLWTHWCVLACTRHKGSYLTHNSKIQTWQLIFRCHRNNDRATSVQMESR